MAGNIFLKVPSIQGTSKVFTAQIELTSVSWGLSNDKNVHSGATTSSSTTSVYDIACSKTMDSSSMTIAQMCANGAQVPKVTLVVAAGSGTGTKPPTAFELDMEDVYISNYNIHAVGTSTAVSENFSLHFAKASGSYTMTEGGKSLGAPGTFAWNSQANAKT
jgi:type VI protein secretion system component Hcp